MIYVKQLVAHYYKPDGDIVNAAFTAAEDMNKEEAAKIFWNIKQQKNLLEGYPVLPYCELLKIEVEER